MKSYVLALLALSQTINADGFSCALLTGAPTGHLRISVANDYEGYTLVQTSCEVQFYDQRGTELPGKLVTFIGPAPIDPKSSSQKDVPYSVENAAAARAVRCSAKAVPRELIASGKVELKGDADRRLAELSAPELELDSPNPSPRCRTTQMVGVTAITVEYGRVGVKGRRVWGQLVPYGEIWRTGAGSSTTISVEHQISIGGTKLEPGKYTVLTIPGLDDWTLILRSWTLIGDRLYDGGFGKEALRYKLKPQQSDMTELLTIEFSDVGVDRAVLTVQWEKIKIAVPIAIDTYANVMTIAARILKYAKKDDWRTPRTVASWLTALGKPTEALTWVDKSLAIKSTWPALSEKAQLLAKLGDTRQALKVAERAEALMKEEGSRPIVMPFWPRTELRDETIIVLENLLRDLRDKS